MNSIIGTLISSTTVLYGIALIILIVAVKRITDGGRASKILSSIPCPKRHFIFGHVLLFMAPREEWFKRTYDLFKDYTPLTVIWSCRKPRVSAMRASAAEKLLSNTRNLDKAFVYDFLQPWLGLGLLTSTGRKWATRRKLLTPVFHFRILEDFLEIISEQGEILISILDQQQGGQSFDVAPFLSRCTLDVICETAMGKSRNVQRNPNSEYLRAVQRMGEVFTYRSLYSWLHPDWIFNRTSYGRSQQQALSVLHGFTNQVIKEKLGEFQDVKKRQEASGPKTEELPGQKRRLAFLDMLVDIYSNDDGALSLKDIREEVDTFMFEGHDTTSSALTFILYNVGRFPEVQKKIQEEIDSVFGDSKRRATIADLNELKYLERVIKESMRLFPPVPFFGRRLTEDLEVCGHLIPAGTSITINTYAVHRDPEYFPNPEEFDPDRFLPENAAKRHPYTYIPFSAGPRNCIGQRFAMMEEKTLVCQILRQFNVKSTQKLEELNILMELVLRSASGIWVTLERR